LDRRPADDRTGAGLWLRAFGARVVRDAAVAKATERGGVLRFGPMDSPFGRFAALSDPQGAAFSVIDVQTTKGDMPKTADVS
jgi:predicted enzyme related to lactoylglutathione lyase